MTVLLDGNVLVAVTVREHVHHEAVVDWFFGRRSGLRDDADHPGDAPALPAAHRRGLGGD